MNNDFIKGLSVGLSVGISVGIVLLILYVVLQPQTGRYVYHDDNYNFIIDTKTGQTYTTNDRTPDKWRNDIGF